MPRYNRIHMKASAFSCFVLALAFLSTPLSAAKRPVTIHDLFESRDRFHSPEPVWRPDGNAFAYVEGGSLWLYDIPSRHSSRWVTLGDLQGNSPQPDRPGPEPFNWQNRRVEESGPQWFPDGQTLLVPTEHGIFLLSPGQSQPRESFTEINARDFPTLSPDGRSVLYRRKSNLYVLDIASRKTVQLTSDGSDTLLNGTPDWVYPEELDLGRASWWSPDSREIVYMQFNVKNEFVYPHEDLISTRATFEPQRYPQAGTPNAVVRVGVVPASGGETKWIDLPVSDQLIARVCWLPGSQSIAIERLNRVQDQLDFLVADTRLGSSRVLFTEHDKTWINTNDDLRFLQGGSQFLWSSERSGFRHLYLYSLEGKLIRQLTTGEWQVNRVAAVDEQHRFVYFTSTQSSPLEDQLYRVSLDGGSPERISQGAGMHGIAIEKHGKFYVDSFSSIDTPPEASLHNSSGKRIAVIKAEDRSVQDAFELQRPEIVKVAAGDGTLLYARLLKPAHFDAAKKYPAVVFVYGGPQAQSVHNVWMGLSWEQALASKGFVVWQLDNRGSYGRGHAFEGPVYREFGKTELSDQRTGIEKLLGMGFVDKDRIGIYGWSFGGYMTLYSLLHAPDIFKVGVAGAPVTDWHNYDTIYTERYMGLPDQNPGGYGNASNVVAASRLQGKLMIVCNFEDDNVLFQNTMQMMTALHNAGKEFEFMLYPQKTHGVTGGLSEGMHEQMTDFLVKNLHP